MSPERQSLLFELSDLRFSFGRRTVLDVAHIAIERGQITLLAGDNGSGKTTLLKIIAGLLLAERGDFIGLGSPMTPRHAAGFCRGRHVYLHQVPYLFDATVEDNVAYGLKQRGRDTAQRRVEIRDVLAWAHLEHLVHRRAHELSAGEKQRVALTRARILAPSLLLLDEITANMDAESRRRTYTMLGDLKRSGSSIVLATHEQEALESLADSRLVLHQGRLEQVAATKAAVIPLHRESER